MTMFVTDARFQSKVAHKWKKIIYFLYYTHTHTHIFINYLAESLYIALMLRVLLK